MSTILELQATVASAAAKAQHLESVTFAEHIGITPRGSRFDSLAPWEQMQSELRALLKKYIGVYKAEAFAAQQQLDKAEAALQPPKVYLAPYLQLDVSKLKSDFTRYANLETISLYVKYPDQDLVVLSEGITFGALQTAVTVANRALGSFGLHDTYEFLVEVLRDGEPTDLAPFLKGQSE